MGYMRRVLLGMVIVAAPVIGMALPARADGGPSGFFATQTPTVDCHEMSIDPPSVPNEVWPVTFHGTINDKPFSRTVDFFSEPENNNATVDTSDLMAAPGPLHVVVTVDSPQWGTSPTVDTTIGCHNRPAATTTSPTVVSEATTALAVLGTSVVTTVEPPTSVTNVLAQSAALPRTGSSSSVPLGAIAIGAAGVGSVAMVVGRRRLTRHGLRRV
jgi:LPXTG-motif cell wall-anchored protein